MSSLLRFPPTIYQRPIAEHDWCHKCGRPGPWGGLDPDCKAEMWAANKPKPIKIDLPKKNGTFNLTSAKKPEPFKIDLPKTNEAFSLTPSFKKKMF